jgi:hypothetical protein
VAFGVVCGLVSWLLLILVSLFLLILALWGFFKLFLVGFWIFIVRVLLVLGVDKIY